MASYLRSANPLHMLHRVGPALLLPCAMLFLQTPLWAAVPLPVTSSVVDWPEERFCLFISGLLTGSNCKGRYLCRIGLQICSRYLALRVCALWGFPPKSCSVQIFDWCHGFVDLQRIGFWGLRYQKG